MPRLIDLLRTRPVKPSDASRRLLGDRLPKFMADLVQDVETEPSIVIDNIAEWYFAHPKVEWNAKDIPNAAPPWSLAWFEYEFPPGHPFRAEPYRWQGLGYWMAAGPRDEGAGLREGWHLTLWPFLLGIGEHALTGPLAGCTVNVAGDGSVERYTPMGWPDPTEEETRIAYGTLFLVVPVMLALSFAHCKNVQEELVSPPPKLSTAHRHRHGKPLTRYRVLLIDPMRETLRAEGREGELGPQRALHICRGHFKTFDRKPLFGKVQGTYWWPEHARGRAELGTVVKDYVISAPAPDGTRNATSETVSKSRVAAGGWPDTETARAIERFAVDRALDIVRELYPDVRVTEQPHSNRGYDIAVEGPGTHRYVEVKGTSASMPGFLISEVERQFSVDHADEYTLVVIADINLDDGAFTPYVHHGAVDESFALRPTRWSATFPTSEH